MHVGLAVDIQSPGTEDLLFVAISVKRGTLADRRLLQRHVGLILSLYVYF